MASSVQLAYQGTIVKVHPIRHDRAKEHGAFATPNGRPRRQHHDAPAAAGVSPALIAAARVRPQCQVGTGTNLSGGYRTLTYRNNNEI